MTAPAVAKVVAGHPLKATGGVSIAPLGTALPTNTSTALNAAYKAGGYIGEDGLTETKDRSVEKIKAWGGQIVKTVQTEFSCTYEFSFIEPMNADVLTTVFGTANVTPTAGTVSTGTLNTVLINNAEIPAKAFVFDIVDGLAKIRISVPNGKITEVGEVTYADGEAIAYTVTVEALPDSSGNNAYHFMDDGIFVP